ncbi:hypothetical protein C7974DRAFT_454715 [Boeremia exigua]|uniref:uncharacterized protein n=1 Tax=Boeremia exigua TaxID=749465 RepID=UPI001E8E87F2|nr:uncharacterized protein C7974DRAFT_454715 [Boeremia exigua]KAH6629797.1 hypothetical protein C7974DRAFT_454715 [Boeremia exigua]
MFWQKSVVLLGLLLGLGSPTPLFVKRVNPYDAGFEDDVYFRADAIKNAVPNLPTSMPLLTMSFQLSRGHAEIKKDQGFKAWSKTKDLPPNLSLWDHCKTRPAPPLFTRSLKTVIFLLVPTYSSITIRSMLKANTLPSARFLGNKLWITDAKWTDNPDFNKAKFQGKPYGTDESNGADPKVFLPLAGFQKNDKRWKEKPWSTVTPANCGSKKRSIFDNFEDKETQLVTDDNEDIDLVTGHSVEMRLVPSYRARRRGKTTKRPATGRSTSRKAPKKKTTSEKNSSKKTPTKKKSCSAAEKKANGGVCLSCTAAEKKKNGGQCPPKSCPLPKTNQQLAQEYYKMYTSLGKGKKATKTSTKKNGLV